MASSRACDSDDVMMSYLNFPAEYENDMDFAASLSPQPALKGQFIPSTGVSTPAVVPSHQAMAGPSHQYNQYKQQTPFAPGAIEDTMAALTANAKMSHYLDTPPSYEGNYEGNGGFDFNTAPTSGTLDGAWSPQGQQLLYTDTTINPNVIDSQLPPMPSPTVPSQANKAGRMYPGMHSQQAAQLRAQQEQRRQVQMHMQQEQQQAMRQEQRQQLQPPLQDPQIQKGKSRAKSVPQDPLVEAKIAQLLHKMRTESGTDGVEGSAITTMPRPKKDEEDMDEDERLLASEEGKKLTSKQRRQLRNKVSARAFRSRRKEYIGHLEAEVGNGVKMGAEKDKRISNLEYENSNLVALVQRLLSSPAFADYLQVESQAPQPTQQEHQMAAPQPNAEPQHLEASKDANPYFAQQQHVNDVTYQNQQIFLVNELPEDPIIDVAALSGKESSSAEVLPFADSNKLELPAMELPVAVDIEKVDAPPILEAPTGTAYDLEGDIFDENHSVSTPAELGPTAAGLDNLFEGITLPKMSPQYELIVVEDESMDSMALKRLGRLVACLEAPLDRMNRLTSQI